jgi:hypothetical protein
MDLKLEYKVANQPEENEEAKEYQDIHPVHLKSNGKIQDYSVAESKQPHHFVARVQI